MLKSLAKWKKKDSRGIWANGVCGLSADSNSQHQADNKFPATRSWSLQVWYPHPSLHVSSLISLQTGNLQHLKVSAAWSCFWMLTLDLMTLPRLLPAGHLLSLLH